jgi:uncharacterized protein (DUF983 family)
MDVKIEPGGAGEPRDTLKAMWRGAKQRCPKCGQGALYSSYLKVSDYCPVCGEALFHQRADDAPPYVTIAIVGHLVVAGIWSVEDAYHPAAWVQAAIWLPVATLLSLFLLPPIKGALVGLQWAQRMHGFDGHEDDAESIPAPPQSDHGDRVARATPALSG